MLRHSAREREREARERRERERGARERREREAPERDGRDGRKTARGLLAYLCHFLYELLTDVLRVELCTELELQWGLLLHILTHHLLVELEPRNKALAVRVLQPEEPDLT